MPNLRGLSRQMIAANEEEFGLHYRALKFPGRQRQVAAHRQRQERLAALSESLQWTAGGTKPYLGKLSPGCQQCVAGAWSCLFINARCNANCFYCPAPQDRTELPATNNLFFRHPEAYANYLRRLDFRGASISGGEPLMTPQRTLAFLRAARQALGTTGHLWMYTNGLLLTREIAAQLAEAGLDEIRFDIGATAYKCERIANARGLIPVISVEIPAVPESVPTLKQILPEFPGLGVQHLNLHQLRLTKHNFRQLSERNYTFLHGEKITVLDSELAALEILNFVESQQLALPVNYCSFVFKHRHQKAAARQRAALRDVQPRETVTRAGFIRKLALCGEPGALRRQVELWQQSGQSARLWKQSEGQLQISPLLFPQISWHRLKLAVAYDQVQIDPQEKSSAGERELRFEYGHYASLSRRAASSAFLLGPSAARIYARTWLDEVRPASLPAVLRIFSQWESVPEGLQRYF